MTSTVKTIKHEEIKYWLALADLSGVKKSLVRRALARLVNAKAVFESALGEPAEFASEFGNELTDAVRDFNEWARVDKELERSVAAGVQIIALDDPGYPKRLVSTFDPPLVLYVKGDRTLLGDDQCAVAIIGTRRPTHYGLEMAEILGRDLASAGCAVVSGMARGCDAAAHKGALSAGGATIAVIGTGLDVVYPPESVRLHGEIAAAGLLVSEFAFGTPPKPEHFPMRNRIISGLSLGVVVVEAPLKSGAMMTARLALDSGRDVLAVPGRAGAEKSAGTNKLIKDGACLVENADDVLNALGLTRIKFKGPSEEEPGKGAGAQRGAVNLGARQERVISALSDDPLHIDDVARLAGLEAKTVSALLTELELMGLVAQLPGKTFVLRRQG